MKEKLYIGTLAAVIWIAAIVGKHFWPDLDTGAIVGACGMVLTGLGVYHVAAPAGGQFVTGTLGEIADSTAQTARLVQSASTAGGTPVNAGGFATVRLLAIVAAIALGLSMLAGCSTVMRGYEAAAVNEVKQVNDNSVALWKQWLCAIPVGAIMRSPDTIEAVNKYCGGGPGQLGAQQPISITVQMPATAASAAKP